MKPRSMNPFSCYNTRYVPVHCERSPAFHGGASTTLIGEENCEVLKEAAEGGGVYCSEESKKEVLGEGKRENR